MRQLPSNVVLNKGVTGCGATTVAIEQDRPTIIAVPFVGLIENKVGQHPEVLGIHGEGGKDLEIRSYMESCKDKPKIMVTWDSLPKVCQALQNSYYDVYKEAQLVVDEWHQLLNSYGFRSGAIQGV